MKGMGFRAFLIALVLIIAVTAVVLVLDRMSDKIQRESEDTAIALLSDNANQVANVLDSQLRSIWAHMLIINNALGAIDNMTKAEAQAFLTDIFPFAVRAELATADGKFINNEGKTGYIVPSEDMLRLFIEGEHICVLKQDGTRDTILFARPVNPVMIDGEEYSFALVYFALNSFLDVITIDSYAGEGQIRVLNDRGFVIMTSDNIEREEQSYYFFKLFENADFVTKDGFDGYEDLQESVLRGENDAVQVVTSDGGNTVISYAKAETLDWYVVIVVDYVEVLGGLAESVYNIKTTTVFFTLAVVLVSMLLVLFISSDANKVRKEKVLLQELNDSLDRSRKVTEEALEIAENANRAKSYFLSNMSHDIRTPMNAISGFNALISKNADDPARVRAYSEKIQTSSRQLLAIISDILDMSKIESGKATLELTETTIGEIIHDAEAMVGAQIRDKHHSFNVLVTNIEHERIIVDKTRLLQILVNLLSNAVKYTPDGGDIRMTVTELRSFTSSAWYEIVVSDNGCGMSEEFLETIFESFSRERDGRTSKIQGTGLGMAITKQLIDLMGGSIEVKSEKGVGSVFTVQLQFQLAEDAEAPERWEKYGIRRALLVTDSVEAISRAEAALLRAGLPSDRAANGKEALMLAEDRRFELAVLDQELSDMHGTDAARKLRSFLPKGAYVVFVSDFETAEEELCAGAADGAIPKPFFLSQLMTKLEDIYERRAAETMHGGGSALAGRNVLIVEDNELNSEILSELLTSSGAHCRLCEDGSQGLDAFISSEPGSIDLIFMDVQMPVMNGYEATRRIRASKHPDAGRVPIIAMTADAFSEDIKAAMDAGMDRHISKPINMNLVEAAARELLISGRATEVRQ